MRLKNLWKYKDKHKLQNIIITILGSYIYSIGISTFIIAAGLYTGGFTGIAQLISDFVYYLTGESVQLSVSLLWLLLNIPAFIIGFKYVGKRFTFLSIVSVLFGSIVLEFVPPLELGIQVTEAEKLLFAIIGGVVTGLGVGITLRVGSSTGGMDIISQYLSINKDRSVGQYSFMLNAVLVFIAGFMNGWLTALYTIINLFISNLVIDKIHTRHNKLTLLIVTEREQEVIRAIHSRITRGITVLPATGAYYRKEKNLLMMVISSYELYNIIAIIREVDPTAFTDVLKSQYIFGNFIKHKVD